MIFVGDYFAIILIIVLCMFYYERKHFLSLNSRIFAACLILIGLTAGTNIFCYAIMDDPSTPLWMLHLFNSLYFLFLMVSSALLTLFLLYSILEHVCSGPCRFMGTLITLSLTVAYLLILISNVKTGAIFYFDESHLYHRGPLNASGYYVILGEIFVIFMAYFRNRHVAPRALRRVLLQIIPCLLIGLLVQRIYREVMVTTFFMAMLALILFLNFQGRRSGVNELTRLNDRSRFFRELDLRFSLKQCFQVFYVELNDPEDLSKHYGKTLDDNVLYYFAHGLRHLIPTATSFQLSRLSFAVIIPTADNSSENRKTMQEYLAKDITLSGQHIHFDCILVEYIVEEDTVSVADFHTKLDYTILTARNENKHYMYYTPVLGEAMHRRHYLLDRIQQVDASHGFEVWLQPIYSLHTDCLCSAEALLRLRDHNGNLIRPDEFIPLAEESDVIYDITWFVIEQVCRFLHDHSALDFISVSVNLPMPQLQIPGFLDRLNSITEKYSIEHRRICLEVTERTFLEDYDIAKECMQSLCQAGYRMFLDDFGVGYSNFSWLLQLPFSCIKLDSSISQSIESDEKSRETVRSLIRLFHERGNHVIAEGAETEAQVSVLADCGVDRIQGYYYAKPMDMDHFQDFYQNTYQHN